MRKRLKDLGVSVDLKLDTKKIKAQVDAALDVNSAERKIYMKYRILRGAALAAALTAVFSVSVFAMTPAGQETIGNIISYFRNEQALEVTSYEALAEYNEEIGASDSVNGYTLTLDNVAADDNFIHVFYTIKSEEKFIEDMNNTTISGPMVWADVAIDGRLVSYFTNHSTFDGYFEDCYTMKFVQKLNVASQDIPDKFKLEIIAADNLAKSGWGVDLSRFYSNEDNSGVPVINLTDEEKSKILYVSADVDKSKIKVNSVTKEINVPLWNENIVAEKVILSPFANQLVVRTTTDDDSDDAAELSAGFVLFDENDVCLDVLNTDLTGTYNGMARNSYEFLKADVNTKQIKFIPITMEKVYGDLEPINKKIRAYPITFETSDYGKVVVTDVRIADGVTEVDYYKDGFYLSDPEFELLGDDGSEVYPQHNGGEMRCRYDVTVNHKDNSYTARYQYYYYDENDNEIPAKEEASAEVLNQRFTTLGLRSENYIKPDFDNAITVELK